MEFVKDQYRHCKSILALGAGRQLLEKATIPLDGDDAAIILSPGAKATAAGAETFIAAIARHRNWDRATDPPLI